ncbi:phytoene/squalene synthase family protein [Paenibacillus sp. IB182496]|uniref:Phytoene/squalene synthase family protein n=1 Tax=Paenibacillus sabuli TaxID=2772509 RepID=A0A927BZ25_9BACL|nr:phytoene/squalene synthase family protein [Paenibacillus sabuli]MBD2848230.1 phytoene/squalene synthase family protein [Paenibacillus sabuli]
MELASALASCESMIKQGSTTFYKAFGYLPSPRREAVFVIYAFCRMIDDAVDEPERAPYPLDELERSFLELERAEGHFIWSSLRWLFATFPALGQEPFLRQMEGQRRDLRFTHYRTMEELEGYCYLVAGTVGEMLLPVLHDRPGLDVVESGIYLGKAMQIVNIVRDVGEDRDRGRRYVPLELMARHGYSEREFEAGEVNEGLRQVIRELDATAREWFRRGLRDLDTYPPASAFSVELAARFYEAILDEVEGGGYQVYTRRAHVGQLRKLKLLAKIGEKYAPRYLATP